MVGNVGRVACAALAVWFTVGVGELAAQDSRQNEPGQFDFYVLALSWSPSFCEASGERGTPPRQQCGARPYSFVVHGLWPQGETTRGPENCGPSSPVSQAIIQLTLNYIPTASLIQHEWKRRALPKDRPCLSHLTWPSQVG